MLGNLLCPLSKKSAYPVIDDVRYSKRFCAARMGNWAYCIGYTTDHGSTDQPGCSSFVHTQA